MKAQRIGFGLLAILVLVGATLSFLNTFELKETEEHVGFKGEAKTNNLYAARLFLKSMGIPAQRQERLSTLPDTDTVLIIDTQRYTLSTQKIEELLAWVERGGHLIPAPAPLTTMQRFTMMMKTRMRTKPSPLLPRANLTRCKPR